jgi:hypothetical protein
MMLQVIDGKTVEVVEFDTMPELPVTGLTREEKVYQDMLYAASYPHGPSGTLAAFGSSLTYAQALTNAIETGIITESGKYGIHKQPANNYEIFKIIE